MAAPLKSNDQAGPYQSATIDPRDGDSIRRLESRVTRIRNAEGFGPEPEATIVWAAHGLVGLHRAELG
jgi:hypothetical protein